MRNDVRNIPRASLGKREAAFLTKVGPKHVFSLEEARQVLGETKEDPTSQFLVRLCRKKWIRRIRRGLYATAPLSSGDEANPQLHEFVVAMELVSPAAISYWTALSYYGMTEQIPRLVYVATNHVVRHPPRDVLGIPYKIVALRPKRFFGIVRDWVDECPFWITDKEKTIIDGLDMPAYVAGLGEIEKALEASWSELDEEKLLGYAERMGNRTIAKRLGYLMERLGVGHPETLRERIPLSAGYSALDPTLPRAGKLNRRWRLLLNGGGPR